MKDFKYKLYNDLIISPRPNDTYKLVEEFKYKDVIVPKNYHTNGADIPRILWSFWPPNRSNYLPAVVIHDYLCDKEEYKKADAYFREILIAIKISKFTINCFYYSVRFYHILRYELLNNNQRSNKGQN